MTDQRLTKTQLQAELVALRQRVAELERRPIAIGSTEAHYRTLVDSLEVSVCRWRPDTTLTFANDKYRRIFGIQGEAVGQRWLDFLPVETRAETAAFYAEVAANPRPLTYEYPVTVDDGQVRQYQWRDTPIYDGQGQVVEFQSVGLDITDRKQAEAAMAESEVRFRGLLDATPDAMVIINGAGQILMVNAQTERMFGYAQSELIGSAVENLLPGHLHTQHLASRAKFMAEPRMVTAGVDRDIYAKHKNGPEFPVEISLSYHKPVNGEAVVLCAIRDVTERQRTRQVIATQRDLARLANANLPPDELWSKIFQATLQVSGLDSGGIYLFNETARVFELVYHAGVSADFANAVSRYSEDTPSAQIILAGHNTYTAHAELSSRAHHQAEGLRSLALIPIQHHAQILGCITVASHTLDSVPDYARNALEILAQEIGNIIRHRHTEEALRVSREQLSQTLVAARMGTWRYDLTTGHMRWSPEASQLFGAELEHNDFSTVLAHFHPDDRAKVIEGLRETIAQKKVLSLEYRLLAANGEILWVTNYGHIEYDAAGRPLAVSGLIQDITERKLSETALAASEKKLKSLVESQSHFMIRANMEGKYSYWNAQFEKEFGWLYEPQGIQNADVLTAVCDYHHQRVKEVVADCVASPGRVFTVELDKPGRSGETRTTLWEFICLTDEHNQPAEIQCMGIEISDRKQAEQALRESEARAQAMLNALPDMMFRLSRAGVFLDYRAEASTLYDQSGSLTGRHISASLPPELVQPIETNLAITLATRQLQTFEYQLELPGAGPREFEARLTPSGADEVIAIVRDITERKQADERLRESEEKYRGLLESLSNVVFTVDDAGRILYVNDMGAERLGGTAANLIGRNMRDIFPEPLAAQQLANIQSIFQTDRAATFEAQSLDTDRALRWYRFSLQPLHAESGQVTQVLINATDIHDLKTTQQELQELNRTLEARVRERAAQVQDLYDNAPTGYHSLDADGRLVAINQTELKWLGYTADQMLGHTFAEFVDEPSAVQFQTTFRALKHDGKVTNLEFDMKRQDGTTFPVLINAVAIVDQHGRYLRSRSTMTDITERKRAETELKRNVNFTNALLEAIPTPVFYKDKEGRYQGCNHAFTDMMGRTSAEIQGKTVHELWPSPNAAVYHQHDLDLMQSCAQQVYEATVVDKQGIRRPVIFVKNVFYDEGSHVAGLVGAFVDITDRKQAEEALHERERHSQSLLRLSRQLEQAQTYSDVLTAARAEVQTAIGYQSLWTYLLTEDKHHARLLTAGGPVEEKLLGMTTLTIGDDPMLEEIVGAREIVVIEDARTDARTNKAIVAALGNRTIVNVPITLFDRNLGSVGVGTFGDEGVRVPTASDRDYLIALASHMAVTFDRIHLLNERKRAEEELQITNAELQRALRVKDEFLASMSHELRTPLNAVLGLSESLIEQFIGPLNERQLRAVQTVESSGRHLLDLINDILDLSKLEANQVALELASVNVDDVCAASFMFIKDIAYKKYIQLTNTQDPAVKYLLADERRLKQMLVNLLSNAVKFTPEGGVVKLQVVGNAADQTVSFAISDTGIGIAPENIARLFQPFVQLDGGLNRQYEGTGLGLSLVARMARLHGGRVTVDSQPGQGSCFTIVLPWKRPMPFPLGAADVPFEPAAKDIPEPVSTAPLILVVEDNESNVVTLSTYLQATGYRVAIARNGHEALEQVRLKRPTLILMDLQMPVMDGLEATRRLRRDSDLQVAGTPVIALTALAMPNDRRRSLEAGANEYVSKPVNLKRLTEVINRLVGGK